MKYVDKKFLCVWLGGIVTYAIANMYQQELFIMVPITFVGCLCTYCLYHEIK